MLLKGQVHTLQAAKVGFIFVCSDSCFHENRFYSWLETELCYFLD